MAHRRKIPIEQDAIEPHQCSIDVRLKILRQLPFFAGLSAKQVEEINRLFREKGYQTGEPIYFSGEPATHLFVVADGKVKIIQHSLVGKDVLLDILTSGEFFGSLATQGEEFYPDTAEAYTPVCALGIDREKFRRILDSYPFVALKVLDLVSERLKKAHELVRQLSAYSTEKRIAYILLKLADKLSEKTELGWLIQTPLSRDDLADMTGTTTETASRVMSQFQKDGLIQTGRQWVAITDRDRLITLMDNPTA